MKQYKTEIKTALIIWGVFTFCLMGCFTAYTVNKIKNETQYNKALIEQIGKPIIHETRYVPMK